jgi:hypothetical protein
VTAPPSSEVDRTVEMVRSGLETARRLVHDIIAGVNSVLDQLPEPAIAGIRPAIADLQRLVNDHIGEAERLIALAGSPDTLRITGECWREVGRLASAQAGKATLNFTQVDDRWTGDAADAYRNTLPAQEKALIAVKARTDEIDTVLQEMANAITSFWADIGVATLALVAGLTSAVISASTVVGAPASAVFAATAIVAFAAVFNSGVTALTDITNACATHAAEFQQALYNDSAFPDGKWQPATTDFSDASLLDDDDTDWHIG